MSSQTAAGVAALGLRQSKDLVPTGLAIRCNLAWSYAVGSLQAADSARGARKGNSAEFRHTKPPLRIAIRSRMPDGQCAGAGGGIARATYRRLVGEGAWSVKWELIVVSRKDDGGQGMKPKSGRGTRASTLGLSRYWPSTAAWFSYRIFDQIGSGLTTFEDR